MTVAAMIRNPGGGISYNWENDHIFIKVVAADSGGAYTLVEDNLKASFALGLHKHETHAETFYILEGSVEFYVEETWNTLEPGAVLHIPPGIPHAARMPEGQDKARMLMIFQPAGFDEMLATIAAMSPQELADPEVMAALQKEHDIIQLGPVPD